MTGVSPTARQELKFHAPVHVGQPVEATITVERLRKTRSGGVIVFCDTVSPPRRAPQPDRV